MLKIRALRDINVAHPNNYSRVQFQKGDVKEFRPDYAYTFLSRGAGALVLVAEPVVEQPEPEDVPAPAPRAARATKPREVAPVDEQVTTDPEVE